MGNFEFIGMGEHQRQPVAGKLFLDVGSTLQPGVIDHHQKEGAVCTARLIVDRPELVTDWIPVGTDDYTLVLHAVPDIDCVSSAYLAEKLIATGELPAGASLFADYVARIDQGRIARPEVENPLPYEIFEIMRGNIPFGPDRDLEMVRAGFGLLDHVFDQLARQAPSAQALDGMFIGSHPFVEQVEEVRTDLRKYEDDLADPDRVQPISILLPRKKTGAPLLKDGLIYRDPTARHFKLWARNDRINAPQEDGFVFTHVIWSNGTGENKDRDRYVISVDPSSDVDLRRLGDVLNNSEREALEASGIEVPGEPRPGYEKVGLADPWYDGRAHDFTIVDTPRRGSELSAANIEQYLYSFMDVDTFGAMTKPDHRVRLMFEVPLGDDDPGKTRARLEKNGWYASQGKVAELSPAFRHFLFERQGKHRQFILMHKDASGDGGPGELTCQRLTLAVYHQGIAVLVIDGIDSAPTLARLYGQNAALRHGVRLSEMIAAGIFSPELETELEVIAACNLDTAGAELMLKLWLVRLRDAHKSRDQKFFDRLLATFIAEKTSPVSIHQSDMDAAEGGTRLGRYGRLVVLPHGATMFMNKVDLEMPEQEQDQMEELFLGPCGFAALNACIQKGTIDHLMAELARSAEEDFESRRLSRRLQFLQERVMELATRGVNHNPATDLFANGFWEQLAGVLKLPELRGALNESVGELAEYVDTRRKSHIDRILFTLSLAIGPLTLLTDYLGGVLSNAYPGPGGFISVLGVTYGVAVVAFASFMFIFRKLR